MAAHSVTRRLFASYAGPLFRLTRTSDQLTRDVGTGATGLYDGGAVDRFCLGTSCYFTTVFDQAGNGDDLTQPEAARSAPWTLHYRNGLPVIWTSNNRASYQNRADTRNLPLGASSSAGYFVIATDVVSPCCGGYGRMEDPVANCVVGMNCPHGAMWALAYSTYSRFTTAPPMVAGAGFGVDNEFFMSVVPAATVPAIASVTAKYDGATDKETTKHGDAAGGPLTLDLDAHPPIRPAVQSGLGLGVGGDDSTAGTQFFEDAVISGTPSDASDDAVQGNVTAFYGAQAVPVPTPTDLLVQRGSVGSHGGLDISTLLGGAWGLRRLRADYTGYAARVFRESDGAAIEIGFTDRGDFDAAAARAFCAGTTCHPLLHSQGLVPGRNDTQPLRNDMVLRPGQAMRALPTLALDGLGGKATLAFDGTQYECTPTGDAKGAGYSGLPVPWTVLSVARRMGNPSSVQDVVEIGGRAGLKLQFGRMAGFGDGRSAVGAPADDGAWHFLAGMGTSSTESLSADGGTPVSGGSGLGALGDRLCVGGDGTGADLTGNLAEVFVSAGALRAAQISALHAEERAYYGDQF